MAYTGAKAGGAGYPAGGMTGGYGQMMGGQYPMMNGRQPDGVGIIMRYGNNFLIMYSDMSGMQNMPGAYLGNKGSSQLGNQLGGKGNQLYNGKSIDSLVGKDYNSRQALPIMPPSSSYNQMNDPYTMKSWEEKADEAMKKNYAQTGGLTGSTQDKTKSFGEESGKTPTKNYIAAQKEYRNRNYINESQKNKEKMKNSTISPLENIAQSSSLPLAV